MKKRKSIIFILFLMILGMSFTNCFREKSFEKRVEKIAKRVSNALDLDDKQKQELERIKKEIIDKHKQQKTAENPESKKQFLEMVRSDKMELAKLKTLIDPRVKAKNEMADFLAVKIVEFHAILKPEQRTKLANKMEKFLNHHNDDID